MAIENSSNNSSNTRESASNTSLASVVLKKLITLYPGVHVQKLHVVEFTQHAEDLLGPLTPLRTF